jgi:hypothetical protein
MLRPSAGHYSEAIKGISMRIDKILVGPTLAMLLVSSLALAADFETGLKAYRSGNFKTALTQWVPLAEQGHVSAQAYLGHMYEQGIGVSRNYNTAVNWYTKAAEQGHAATQKTLGHMYDYGRGVAKNHKTAVKWYTLAAEQGLVGAQHTLGYNHEKGIGVPTNYKTALKWYTQSAGFFYSQYRLGDMYFRGLGVPIDYQRAYMWWNLANSTNYFPDMGNKEDAAKLMTPAGIAKANAVSSRCLNSGYTDCGFIVDQAYICELDSEQTKGRIPSSMQISFNNEKQVTKLDATDHQDYDLDRVKVLKYTKDFKEIQYTALYLNEDGGTSKAIHTITLLPKLNYKITYVLKLPNDSNQYNAHGTCNKMTELEQLTIKNSLQISDLDAIDPFLANGVKNERWVQKLYKEYQSKDGYKALAIASTNYNARLATIESLGYGSGKTNAKSAMQQAMAECKKHNKTSASCKVIDQRAIE